MLFGYIGIIKFKLCDKNNLCFENVIAFVVCTVCVCVCLCMSWLNGNQFLFDFKCGFCGNAADRMWFFSIKTIQISWPKFEGKIILYRFSYGHL